MRCRPRDVEHINLGRQAGGGGLGSVVSQLSKQDLVITRLQYECFIYAVFDTLGLKIH